MSFSNNGSVDQKMNRAYVIRGFDHYLWSFINPNQMDMQWSQYPTKMKSFYAQNKSKIRVSQPEIDPRSLRINIGCFPERNKRFGF